MICNNIIYRGSFDDSKRSEVTNIERHSWSRSRILIRRKFSNKFETLNVYKIFSRLTENVDISPSIGTKSCESLDEWQQKRQQNKYVSAGVHLHICIYNFTLITIEIYMLVISEFIFLPWICVLFEKQSKKVMAIQLMNKLVYYIPVYISIKLLIYYEKIFNS